MSLRVALIGAGYFAGFHAEAWHRLEGCELVGVCDLDRDAAAKLAGPAPSFGDARQMVETLNPDLIDIATPPSTHKDFVDLAIECATPAICQKPLADTQAEAQEIVAKGEQAGHKLIVHENFRFQPWYREAKRLLDAGTLGTPLGIAFRLRPGDGQGPDAYLARQPYFQQMPRFLIHETGIHWIDTFRYLLGEITSVDARLRRLNPVIAGEDAGIVHFNFESGATGLFDGNRLARHAADNPRLTMGEMWLEGEAATLRLDGNGQLWLQPHAQGEHAHDYPWQNRGFAGDCVAALQSHVIDHFLAGRELENAAVDYLRNIEIEEAVYRSHEENRSVLTSA